MYIFVRNDLTNAQKIVQCGHAAFEASRRLDKEVQHPNFVLLSIKNENKLKQILEEMVGYGFQVFPFVEENKELTAFAVGYIGGGDREKFKRFQLVT